MSKVLLIPILVAQFVNLATQNALADTPNSYGEIHLSIDTLEYVLKGSTISVVSDGHSRVVANFPPVSMALLLHYFPELPDALKFNPSDSIPEYQPYPCEISAACVYQGRIWVGFGVYDSEGFLGIGGVGFWDPQTGQLGVLRHPSLFDNSVVDLLVVSDTIFVKSSQDEELCRSIGYGLIAINRHTLMAVARKPLGKDMLFDKDYPQQENDSYKRPIAQLIRDPRFRSTKVPNFPPSERKVIRQLGADRYMIRTAINDRALK
jgi:hypothetical protein